MTPDTLTTATPYVLYTDALEQPDDDEAETIAHIIEAMRGASDVTEKRYGRAVRTSHAKAHGIAKGELRVLDGLADVLKQGLFADAKTFPVVVRLAHVPGELLDDSKVSTPRGMAIKVLGVDGPMLEAGGTTQDFVLDTGKVFPSPGPKAFLATIKTIGAAAPAPQGLKEAMSVVSRVTNTALNALGANSPNLDFFGHPKLLPLAESYYSQTPFRFGRYVAKLRVRPVTPALVARADETLDLADDENGLRTAVVGFLRSSPAEYEVAVQLCTDLDAMPIENAHAEWSEDDSPFVPVAHLVLPAQDAYTVTRQAYGEGLSFSPAHALAAFRPLGGLNRARLAVYGPMAAMRRSHNGASLAEPSSTAIVPD